MNLLNIFQIYLKGSLSIIIFHIKVYLIARNFPLKMKIHNVVFSEIRNVNYKQRDKGITYLFFLN